ncbi:MAG: DUF6470 family protein [Thermoanaerobacteraceae bacterium]
MTNIIMHQTLGRIGIETTPAKINIKNKNADLQIEQIQAKMEIDQKLPQVHIDQYQCFYEAGLKSIFDLIHDEAARSRQLGLEAIGEKVEEGHILSSIQNHENAIAELAKKARIKQASFNVDLIPKSRPQIWFEGYLNINWQLGKAKINITPQKPEISATPSNINIYMLKYPSLDIEIAGNKFDKKA